MRRSGTIVCMLLCTYTLVILVVNKQASKSSCTNNFLVIYMLSRTRNLHDFRQIGMTESTKYEQVITQKQFELQPYGLTCVVILTCGLIGKILVEFKNMSATCLG